MSVKHLEYLKINKSKVLVVEIRPVKCFVDTPSGPIHTDKWMESSHWKDLYHLMNDIVEEFEELKNTQGIQYNQPKCKTGSSIQIGYMLRSLPSCWCSLFFLTPRNSCTWTESNDDGELHDKGGRFEDFTLCGEMLVISVILQDYSPASTSEITPTPSCRDNFHQARLNHKLMKALDNRTTYVNSISNYFKASTTSADSSSAQCVPSSSRERRSPPLRVKIPTYTSCSAEHESKGNNCSESEEVIDSSNCDNNGKPSSEFSLREVKSEKEERYMDTLCSFKSSEYESPMYHETVNNSNVSCRVRGNLSYPLMDKLELETVIQDPQTDSCAVADITREPFENSELLNVVDDSTLLTVKEEDVETSEDYFTFHDIDFWSSQTISFLHCEENAQQVRSSEADKAVESNQNANELEIQTNQVDKLSPNIFYDYLSETNTSKGKSHKKNLPSPETECTSTSVESVEDSENLIYIAEMSDDLSVAVKSKENVFKRQPKVVPPVDNIFETTSVKHFNVRNVLKEDVHSCSHSIEINVNQKMPSTTVAAQKCYSSRRQKKSPTDISQSIHANKKSVNTSRTSLNIQTWKNSESVDSYAKALNQTPNHEYQAPAQLCKKNMVKEVQPRKNQEHTLSKDQSENFNTPEAQCKSETHKCKQKRRLYRNSTQTSEVSDLADKEKSVKMSCNSIYVVEDENSAGENVAAITKGEKITSEILQLENGLLHESSGSNSSFQNLGVATAQSIGEMVEQSSWQNEMQDYNIRYPNCEEASERVMCVDKPEIKLEYDNTAYRVDEKCNFQSHKWRKKKGKKCIVNLEHHNFSTNSGNLSSEKYGSLTVKDWEVQAKDLTQTIGSSEAVPLGSNDQLALELHNNFLNQSDGEYVAEKIVSISQTLRSKDKPDPEPEYVSTNIRHVSTTDYQVYSGEHSPAQESCLTCDVQISDGLPLSMEEWGENDCPQNVESSQPTKSSNKLVQKPAVFHSQENSKKNYSSIGMSRSARISEGNQSKHKDESCMKSKDLSSIPSTSCTDEEENLGKDNVASHRPVSDRAVKNLKQKRKSAREALNNDSILLQNVSSSVNESSERIDTYNCTAHPEKHDHELCNSSLLSSDGGKKYQRDIGKTELNSSSPSKDCVQQETAWRETRKVQLPVHINNPSTQITEDASTDHECVSKEVMPPKLTRKSVVRNENHLIVKGKTSEKLKPVKRRQSTLIEHLFSESSEHLQSKRNENEDFVRRSSRRKRKILYEDYITDTENEPEKFSSDTRDLPEKHLKKRSDIAAETEKAIKFFEKYTKERNANKTVFTQASIVDYVKPCSSIKQEAPCSEESFNNMDKEDIQTNMKKKIPKSVKAKSKQNKATKKLQNKESTPIKLLKQVVDINEKSQLAVKLCALKYRESIDTLPADNGQTKKRTNCNKSFQQDKEKKLASQEEKKVLKKKTKVIKKKTTKKTLSTSNKKLENHSSSSNSYDLDWIIRAEMEDNDSEGSYALSEQESNQMSPTSPRSEEESRESEANQPHSTERDDVHIVYYESLPSLKGSFRRLQSMTASDLEQRMDENLVFLEHVAMRQVYNERHEMFITSRQKLKKQQDYLICGPFSVEQLEHVLELLKKKLSHLDRLFENVYDIFSYQCRVLMPTFLTKIIMDNENISLPKAEELLMKLSLDHKITGTSKDWTKF